APFLLSRSASARTGHVERHATRLTTRSQSPKATTEECRTMGVELAANGAAAQPGRSWPLAGSSHRQRGIPAEEDIMLIEHAHPPGASIPATAGTAPARPTCWTTTGRCNARSGP